MANITNKEVITFSNDFLRTYADKISQCYYAAKIMVNQWNAQDMSNKITNDGNDYIADTAYGTSGSNGDGRPIVTGEDAYLLYSRASELISDMEAGSNAKLNTILSYAVNPQR